MAKKTKKRSAKKKAPARREWTTAEVNKLKKMASRRPAGIIAYELDRSIASVRSKVQTLGISMKPAERSPYGR